MNYDRLQELIKIQEEITKQQEIIIEMLKERIIYLENEIKEKDRSHLEFLESLKNTLNKKG